MGFATSTSAVFQTGKGLTRDVVIEISRQKNEPEWMLEFRLKSLEQFLQDADAADGEAIWTIWILMIFNTM